MIFENYGDIKWIDPKDFYNGAWSIYKDEIGIDGDRYTLVISGDRNEIRYTTV